MIITPQNTGMLDKQGDEPPPYDFDVSNHRPLAVPSPIEEERLPLLTAPTYTPISSPVVYQYTNPITLEQITSDLPPDHPQIVCLQTGHEPLQTFGLLGILAAVIWFPIGIGCCLLDRRSKCARCGATLSTGLCD